MRIERALAIYNDQSPEALKLAQTLSDSFPLISDVCSAGGLDGRLLEKSADLVITVGGDGTILRAARHFAPLGVPLLGVNLGKVGFMTEIEGADALELIPEYLKSDFAWIQERAMLQVDSGVTQKNQNEQDPLYALNDVVVGRESVARMVELTVSVNGATLTTHRADAVIVATATGSTGYALSAGGPIIHPESTDILIKPVASHITLSPAVIVPGDAVVELTLNADQGGAFSADGSPQIGLPPGGNVRIVASSLKAKFLRSGSPDRFYSSLVHRLKREMLPPERT